MRNSSTSTIHGLWSFRTVRFSAAGTLLATAAAMVGDAPAGQFSEELDNLLHVGTQDVLRKLVQQRKLTRRRTCRPVLVLRRRPHPQDAATERNDRRALLAFLPGWSEPVPDADLMPDQLRAAIVLFASLLDATPAAGCTPALHVPQVRLGRRRPYRRANSVIDPGTVARGRKQLLAQDIERERVRYTFPAAGARPWKKNSRGDHPPSKRPCSTMSPAIPSPVSAGPAAFTEKIATELATLVHPGLSQDVPRFPVLWPNGARRLAYQAIPFSHLRYHTEATSTLPGPWPSRRTSGN